MLRIVQIIDSLEAGGAERMAVSYANTLSDTIALSALVATRTEGLLKSKIAPGVKYLHLNKRHFADVAALKSLYHFCKLHQINIAHAHSSSYFTAFLLRCLIPEIKIIWHDHYGFSDRLCERPKFPLNFISRFFSGIISVNGKLKEWAHLELKFKNVLFLENFVPSADHEVSGITLCGNSGMRILCLANIRPQKNHMMLIEVAKKLKKTHPDWTFHLVGKDFNDATSARLKTAIETERLCDNVYLYGSQSNVSEILSQSDISILTSLSEGLPVSVLESAMARKAVVVTNVGELPAIIENGHNGFIVPNNDVEAFYTAITRLIEDRPLRTKMGMELFETVNARFSESIIKEAYISWIGKTII